MVIDKEHKLKENSYRSQKVYPDNLGRLRRLADFNSRSLEVCTAEFCQSQKTKAPDVLSDVNRKMIEAQSDVRRTSSTFGGLSLVVFLKRARAKLRHKTNNLIQFVQQFRAQCTSHVSQKNVRKMHIFLFYAYIEF